MPEQREDGVLTASIIVIGDEILGGFVQDTNSGWIAQRLTDHGVDLLRIETVPDELAAIDHALQRALDRPRPHLVLTTGGIGSTPDDLTYEAVAASLGRGLALAEELAARIDGALTWTSSQGIDVDDLFADQMMRMARIPEGAQPLRASGSWAPGVRVDVDGGVDGGGATVVILPGVPDQLRTIVTGVIEPDLLEDRGREQEVVEITHGFPESAMNRCFLHLAEEYPDVKVGSYPGWPMIVRLRGEPHTVRSAADEVATYVRELEQDPAGARLREAWERRLLGSDR